MSIVSSVVAVTRDSTNAGTARRGERVVSAVACATSAVAAPRGSRRPTGPEDRLESGRSTPERIGDANGWIGDEPPPLGDRRADGELERPRRRSAVLVDGGER